jgi:O-antigen ligase
VGKALKAIAHYPVLGLGAGNFLVYSEVWKAVHVSYLQIAADGGIPVLVLYLLFFGHGFANLRHLRQLQTDDDTMLFVNSLHASLIGFVVGAAFAPQAYLYFPYLTVGYTSVLAAIVKDQKRPEVDPVATLRAGFGGYRGSRVRAVPAN